MPTFTTSIQQSTENSSWSNQIVCKNKQSEKEIKRTIPFKIASQRIKIIRS